MNLIRVPAIIYFLYLIQIIDSKKFRVVVSDEILPYDLEKTVKSFSDIISSDNFEMERFDDDLKISGYFEWKISKDPDLPVSCSIRTLYFENSKWNDGQIQASIADTCAELINPARHFYNITKLWTSCPPQKGDKWVVERQTITSILDLPPSIPIKPWRAYILCRQGVPGYEKTKDGYGFDFELVPI